MPSKQLASNHQELTGRGISQPGQGDERPWSDTMAQFTVSAETTDMLTDLLKNGMPDGMDYKVMEFWDDPGLIQYLHGQGYTLYRRIFQDEVPTEQTSPALPVEISSEASYPYAYYDSHQQTEPLLTKNYSGKVVYAQDAELKHVAMKLVLADSDEYRILCFLHEQGLETLQENCILPILDIIPLCGFWLAIMPRWGCDIDFPDTNTMRGLLAIMRSMLKGLAFLHANNIIHRDVKMNNMLVNQFADDTARMCCRHATRGFEESRFGQRVEMQKQGKLLYAMMDYNISIVAPRNIRKGEYRRPYRDSFWGTYYNPFDTSQGEFDYDPFAYDVGTLGVVLSQKYQHLSRDIPLLAPLLDKMTTRDIPNRFTAEEALLFLEEAYSDLSDCQLDIVEYPRTKEAYLPHDQYDRWQDLPENLKQKWAEYREPPIPLKTKVLRYIFLNERLSYFLHSFRWLLRVASLPQLIWTRLVTSSGLGSGYINLR